MPEEKESIDGFQEELQMEPIYPPTFSPIKDALLSKSFEVALHAVENMLKRKTH